MTLMVVKFRANRGILFGTDTSAANALDDYEEGTWTPVFNVASGSVYNGTRLEMSELYKDWSSCT